MNTRAKQTAKGVGRFGKRSAAELFCQFAISVEKYGLRHDENTEFRDAAAQGAICDLAVDERMAQGIALSGGHDCLIGVQHPGNGLVADGVGHDLNAVFRCEAAESSHILPRRPCKTVIVRLTRIAAAQHGRPRAETPILKELQGSERQKAVILTPPAVFAVQQAFPEGGKIVEADLVAIADGRAARCGDLPQQRESQVRIFHAGSNVVALDAGKPQRGGIVHGLTEHVAVLLPGKSRDLCLYKIAGVAPEDTAERSVRCAQYLVGRAL